MTKDYSSEKRRRIEDQNKKGAPFHTIVVTSPDATAAEAARLAPLKRENLPAFIDRNTNLISSSDPLDTRMGSGGGTLAAIQEADNVAKIREDYGGIGSILIIHAGGQSSRCPTQMTLGKAWTDLPLAEQTTQLSNPTYILIESLSMLLQNLPCGSIVVAASDVILDLKNGTPISFQNISGDIVLGLAVPAPLATAKNHGVFQVNLIHNRGEHISDVESFFQKPSIHLMNSHQGCVFTHNGQQMAWIDTGVVIFLPVAADALRNLISHELSHYTRSGLESRLAQEKGATPGAIINLKLELYSHLLLAIPTKGSKERECKDTRLKKYLSNESNADFCSKTLEMIFDNLSGLELKVCTILDGSFTHLGTTKELIDFLISRAKTQNREESKGAFSLSCRRFAFLNGVQVDDRSIIMNSIIDSSSSSKGPSFIGSGSVVEHCNLENTTIRIGSSCIVSGLRGYSVDVIEIPSYIVFQVLPLSSNECEHTTQYVCMYLHVTDHIKKHSLCFGVPFEILLDETGLAYDELWSNEDSHKLLWNARIHPVILVQNQGLIDWTPFIWINRYLQEGKESLEDSSVQASLLAWRQLKRLSLSEIQDIADASYEFQYRSMIRSKYIPDKVLCSISSIREVLFHRDHAEVKLDFLIDLLSDMQSQVPSEYFRDTIKMFQEVILFSVKNGAYDIGSRALMLLGAVCNDISKTLRPPCSAEVAFNEEIFSYLDSLKSLSDSPLEDCNLILKCTLDTIESAISLSNTAILSKCSSCLEEAAFSLTARCVVTSCPQAQYDQRKFIPLGTWVISSAPARVDLSGGWSDTPPISYEFGGAVACLAVTLCDRKPLSARCRLTSDITGIKLTVENRDIENGEIRESDSVHIKTAEDLSDFRDPLAKCALLKCALVVLGIIPMPSRKSNTNETADGILCTLRNLKVGLELVSTSLLPHGSGLGTSSILAGCVLSSLGRCVGTESVLDKHELVGKVLNLEQLLSTGGGWQDQVGGIFGGLKLCTADSNIIPVRVHVEQYEIPHETLAEFNERLVLAYSGQPRLAKNILQNVVRRWAKRTPEIVKNVNDLVNGARLCITSIQRNNFEDLGSLLTAYWAQKKIMAGEDSGVDPITVKRIFDLLSLEGVAVGSTLTGAGGGGFMTMILREGMTVQHANRVLENCEDFDHKSLKWYTCKICNEGLESFMAHDSITFNIDWHDVKVTDT
eukprot:CAMPEP_0176478596 /NCGR_PEP_ID=MMETSP0200_2-20121128/1270_1 /TAXON_ID=947934 /ORGANISM="Chaetoceros sp., Strain GSL56" /LENGTH=1200 /DNA_ID=CAMNT_0017874543 /DNA_START=62 /DNA_END=3667 /DNA_ORIENTATION=+